MQLAILGERPLLVFSRKHDARYTHAFANRMQQNGHRGDFTC